MLEKMAPLLACWHTKLENLHAVWHVGTLIWNIRLIDLENATWKLFSSGKSSKGLGQDIFYVVSKYMLCRERKTSHFGVVGECEEGEWKFGKCGRK